MKLKKKALEKYIEFNNTAKNKEVLFILIRLEDILFFYSSLKTLNAQNFKIKILVFFKTSNDFIDNVANLLPGSTIEFSENDKLKDNELTWDESSITSEIEDFIDKNHSVGTIITSDDKGFGQSKNIQFYKGLMHFLLKNKHLIKDRDIQIFNLDSFNVVNVYSLLFPVIYFYFKLYGFFNANIIESYRVAGLFKYHIAKKFLRLFSSYTYFNSFTKVEYKDD